MTTNRRTEDPAQADRAWSGYHPRAAIPAVAAAAVASLVMWTGRWYLDPLSELADRYIKDPLSVVAVGQVVQVRVLSVDKQRGRVQLSMKGIGLQAEMLL